MPPLRWSGRQTSVVARTPVIARLVIARVVIARLVVLALVVAVAMPVALPAATAAPGEASPATAPTDQAPPVAPRPRSAAEQSAETLLFDGHLLARRDPTRFGHGSEAPAPPLAWDEQMAEVARQWSDRMATDQHMRHNPHYTEQTCCWRWVGENVAYAGGFHREGHSAAEANAAWIMQAWMDSDGHRTNILNERFDQVGIGVSIDDQGWVWSTAVFRETRVDQLPAPSPEPSPDPPPAEQPSRPSPTIRDTSSVCPAVDTTRFVDVARHLGAIECLAEHAVTHGTSHDRYEPAGTVDRAQMAAFIDRIVTAAGGDLPQRSSVDTFPDVSADSRGAEAILRLHAAGVVAGHGDGSYRPAQPVTRGQMAHFLVATHELLAARTTPEPSTSWFEDVTAGDTFATPINQAADLGLAAGGADGAFRPGANVRRDHMALFLTRLLAALEDATS